MRRRVLLGKYPPDRREHAVASCQGRGGSSIEHSVSLQAMSQPAGIRKIDLNTASSEALPEPRQRKLNADRVDASAEAYQRFSTPKAVLGLGSYTVTMALAGPAGKDGARKRLWISLALAGKAVFDIARSWHMARTQWIQYRAFCFGCLVSATATLTTAVLTFGEACEAGRELVGRLKTT